jgi:hypothetical protein
VLAWPHMVKKSSIVWGGVVIVVFASLCYGAWQIMGKWAKESTGDNGSAREENNANGSVHLREVKETRHEDVEGTGGCDVKMTYVLVDDTPGLSAEARDRMNDVILATVSDFFPADGVSLSEAATSFVQTCQTDLRNLVQTMDDPIVVAQEAWTTDIGYTVHQNEQGILSLAFSNTSYFGGAHPNVLTMFTTFDTATGNSLTLRDVIEDTGLQAFAVREKQWLLDNLSAELFEESVNEFTSYIASPADDTTQRYIDDALFYLTPDAVGTFYNAYAIAPYVAGAIDVRLQRSDLGATVKERFR